VITFTAYRVISIPTHTVTAGYVSVKHEGYEGTCVNNSRLRDRRDPCLLSGVYLFRFSTV